MNENGAKLGRLIAVYGVAPEYLQRAVFIALLSFVFFLAMMIAYYMRGSALFFLLATAFLIVYVVTMISWVIQRRGVVEVFEHGLDFRKKRYLWPEIADLNGDGKLTLADGRDIQLPKTLGGLSQLTLLVRTRTTAGPREQHAE